MLIKKSVCQYWPSFTFWPIVFLICQLIINMAMPIQQVLNMIFLSLSFSVFFIQAAIYLKSDNFLKF